MHKAFTQELQKHSQRKCLFSLVKRNMRLPAFKIGNHTQGLKDTKSTSVGIWKVFKKMTSASICVKLMVHPERRHVGGRLGKELSTLKKDFHVTSSKMESLRNFKSWSNNVAVLCKIGVSVWLWNQKANESEDKGEGHIWKVKARPTVTNWKWNLEEGDCSAS